MFDGTAADARPVVIDPIKGFLDACINLASDRDVHSALLHWPT